MEYSIHLNKDEAKVLRAILRSVGGPRDKSRRKYADSIIKKLKKLGFSVYKDSSSDGRGLIHFVEIPEMAG